MKIYALVRCFIFSIAVCCTVSVLAVDFVWDNSDGDNDFANPLNWVGDAFLASETAVINLDGSDKAVLSSGSPANIDRLNIGDSSGNGEFEQTGGTLSATSNSSSESHVGSGSGNTGTWTMSGGTADINSLQLGLSSGTGNLTITGGAMDIKRGEGDYSLHVGAGGTGDFEISGGSLITRTGILVANGSTFKVSGSAASTIGVGSSGTLDGHWVQEAGGTLCIEVDTITGITKILIDETDGTGGASYDGDVTFEAGSLLDVSFVSSTNPGTFTVMEWEGDLLSNGLAFASSVDTNVWSFNVDAVSKKLTVTAIGTPLGRPDVTVNSFAGLRLYMGADNHDVTMTPGTYRITPADVTSGLFPNPHLFEFTGTNSIFDFTGVTIEVETEVLQSFGSVDIREIYVIGNDLVLSNLTLIDIGLSKPTFRAQSILMNGRRNRIDGFNVVTRGSYPYGYGDIFGKGGGPVIGHDKHSAILVMGIDNHLKNTKIFHRSYGHGIFCQGSQNAIIEGCYVEGETRTSDDVLAEAGSGSAADNVNFETDWEEVVNGVTNGYTLQPGWMFSLHEAGIRAYNTGLSIDGVNSTNTTDITVIDCTVNKMRTGVNIGFCNDKKAVTNCVVIDVESGLWLGTEGEAVNFAGNAAHGPLLVTANYANDRDSVADITVLDSSNRYGNELLAYIAGTRDEVTFHCRDEYVDTNLVIKVAGIRTGIRQHYINPKYNDHAATDAVLHNYTQFPVEMGTKSADTSGQTGGVVVDLGSGNSLTPISVNTAGGFAVIQTIEAEGFSSQSGASVMTRGDGVRFASAVNAGDWICFENFFMGSGPNRFEARVAGGAVAGDIELRLDSVGGELIGTCSVSSNFGSVVWSKETITLDEPRGKHDLYLVFKGMSGELPEIDSFRFYVTFPGWKSSRGLVGHWKFDDGAGTTAIDSSGFGHHGTLANAAWVSGKKGGALDFNATASTVSIPVSAFDTIQEEVTIAFWAYGDAAAQPVNNSAFFAEDNGDRVLNVHLPYGNSNIYWDAGEGSSYDRIFKAASPPEFEGSWAHWVFTKNAKTGNLRIYRNGEMWHHAAFLMKEIFEVTHAAIGSQIGGSANYKGRMDDVRLYDVELMEHEVTELYNSYSYTDAGTPHSWLDAHGLVTGGDYEAADLVDGDGDELQNGKEYWAGTNPMNPASSFNFIDAGTQGNQMVVDWSAVAGKTYDVWFRTNLTAGAWTLLDSGVSGEEPSCSSTVQTANASGFIQVEVEQ